MPGFQNRWTGFERYAKVGRHEPRMCKGRIHVHIHVHVHVDRVAGVSLERRRNRVIHRHRLVR